MSDKKEIERKLKENGFVIRRKATHGVFWEKGGARVMVPLTPSDGRWVNNCNADIERILRTYKKAQEIETVPVVKNDTKTVTQTHGPRSRRYDDKTLLQVDAQITELMAMFKDNPEIATILNAQGFTKSSGKPIDAPYVSTRRYVINKKNPSAPVIAKPAVVPVIDAIPVEPIPMPVVTVPVAVAAPMPAYQFNKKLNDTVMALLTDPCLTDKQKVRMLLAYGEE